MNHEGASFSTCRDVRNFYDSFALAEVVQENPAHAPDEIIFRKAPVEITSQTNRVKHEGLMPEQAIIEAMDQMMAATHKTRVTIKSRLSKIPQAHYLVDKNEKPFHYRLNMKMLLGSKEWFTQALRWPESLKSNVKSHSDCKSN